MRTFGVEEELLLVDAATFSPLPAGDRAVQLHVEAQEAMGQRADPGEPGDPSGHEITTEFQQEQFEVAYPPQTTLAAQLETIRAGRALADTAASRVGGRVVALPTSPGPISPHLVPNPRYQRISERFGFTVKEQLTCGFHIHVQVESPEEAVAVLDRIRVWLPVVLALSANSPFWQGFDTDFASYRYQAWNRWPTAGPTDVFGSADAYEQHRAALLSTGVPLDPGMLYFDARVCEHHPTVEIRVADVCLEAEHAATIATLVRALVETVAREWAAGIPAPEVPASVLQLWSWRASRYGTEEELIDQATGQPAPAAEVLAGFIKYLRPVLAEYGELTTVEATVADILADGTGARRQRAAYAVHGELVDVITTALDITHRT